MLREILLKCTNPVGHLQTHWWPCLTCKHCSLASVDGHELNKCPQRDSDEHEGAAKLGDERGEHLALSWVQV